jgi:hypothetical protein
VLGRFSDAWRHPKTFTKGVVVSDEELAATNIVRGDFHGEWNYTIKPSNRSDGAVDS